VLKDSTSLRAEAGARFGKFRIDIAEPKRAMLRNASICPSTGDDDPNCAMPKTARDKPHALEAPKLGTSSTDNVFSKRAMIFKAGELPGWKSPCTENDDPNRAEPECGPKRAMLLKASMRPKWMPPISENEEPVRSIPAD